MLHDECAGIKRWSRRLESSGSIATISSIDPRQSRPTSTPLIPARHSILIENLGETLEAVLTPVIQRAVIYRGRKMYIKLGDSEVEFHPDFRSVLLAILSKL